MRLGYARSSPLIAMPNTMLSSSKYRARRALVRGRQVKRWNPVAHHASPADFVETDFRREAVVEVVRGSSGR